VLAALTPLLPPPIRVTGFLGLNTGGFAWGPDDPHVALEAFAVCALAPGSAALSLRRSKDEARRARC
jgi:hypothetical protein